MPIPDGEMYEIGDTFTNTFGDIVAITHLHGDMVYYVNLTKHRTEESPKGTFKCYHTRCAKPECDKSKKEFNGPLIVEDAVNQHDGALENTFREQDRGIALVNIAADIYKRLHAGGKLLIAGNGGSAADAQHIAAEFVGRYEKERKPLSAIALTTDTSALTAIANDYQYCHVFERQVEALGRPGDVFLGITTSGKSENIILASLKAKACKMLSVIFTSTQAAQGRWAHADWIFRVQSDRTPRIQEIHILAGHIVCELVDAMMKAGE